MTRGPEVSGSGAVSCPTRQLSTAAATAARHPRRLVTHGWWLQMRPLMEMEHSGLVPLIQADRLEDLLRLYQLFRCQPVAADQTLPVCLLAPCCLPGRHPCHQCPALQSERLLPGTCNAVRPQQQALARSGYAT